MKKTMTRQERYEERQRMKGYVRVVVWVPEERRDALLEYGESLREAPAAAVKARVKRAERRKRVA